MTRAAAKLQPMAHAIGALAMDAVQQANGAHPGMPMGMADVAAVLYSQFIKFDPAAPRWSNLDRFILSAGHGSMLHYAPQHLTKYVSLTILDLKNFRRWHSPCAGWERFTGSDRLNIGIDRFGAAVPANQLYAYFGITAQAIALKITARLDVPTLVPAFQ